MPRVPALFVHVYLPGCKCNYREGGRGGWWVVRVEGGGSATGGRQFLVPLCICISDGPRETAQRWGGWWPGGCYALSHLMTCCFEGLML